MLQQKAPPAAHPDETDNHFVACSRNLPRGCKPGHGKGRSQPALNTLLQKLSPAGSRCHILILPSWTRGQITTMLKSLQAPRLRVVS